MALTQSHVKQWVIDQHLDTWGPVGQSTLPGMMI